MTKSNSEIGRRWVTWNENEEGRDHAQNRNMSFSGPVLYSRLTPIACYHSNKLTGRPFVLVSANRYSPSTGGQILRTTRRTSVPTCYVPFIGATGGWSSEPVMGHGEMLKRNAEALNEQLGETARHCIKLWHKLNDHRCRSAIQYRQDKLVEFIEASGVDFSPLPIDEIMAAVEADRYAKKAAWDDPKAAARRERARARRLAMNVLTNNNQSRCEA